MSFWNYKKHDEFAITLAEEFVRKFPPDIDKPDKKAERNQVKAINFVCNQARDYGVKMKPGMYGKARIGNKFMWTLKDAGYEEALIELLTKDLLISLSKKS